MKTLVITMLMASLLVETYQQPSIYPGCWTEWFDRDDPTYTGDWEKLDDLRDENPGKICDKPRQIEVQTVSGDSVASTGDVIYISDTTIGFICKNADQRSINNKAKQQTRMCSDYKVRFMCPEKFCQPKVQPGCWTDWFDRDDPTATGDWEKLEDLRNENPGKICEGPLQMEVRTTSGGSVASTGNVIAADRNTPSYGFVCKNSDQSGSMCWDYKVRFLCPEHFCNPK